MRKWKRWLKRIEQEQISDLVINQHIFRQFQNHVACYRDTTQHAEFAEWILQLYTANATTTVRRVVDKTNRKWKSISLRILLEDMAKNPCELSRKHFYSRYHRSSAQRFAERDFEGITRKKGALSLTPNRVNRDIKELERSCAVVHRFVNKVVAHTEEDRRKIGKLKYKDLDKAIQKIVDTFQRYSLLVTGRMTDLTYLTDDYDVSDSLNLLWPPSSASGD